MSAILTLSASARTIPVLSARGVLPYRGAWYWMTELDAVAGEEPAADDLAILTIEGRAWAGYVVRVREWQGRTRVFFEAGRHGMRQSVSAQQYDGALIGTIASQIITQADELLSPSALTSTTVLDRYHRVSGAAGLSLSTLLDLHGYVWRMDDLGAVWWGLDTWPEAPIDGVLEIEPWGDLATTELSPLSPTLSPGQTWAGRQIERVVYELSEDEPLSAVLHFRRDEGGGLKGAFSRAVRAQVPELPYLARHPASVAMQGTDGRLELVPDEPGTVAGSPPIVPLYGLPGARCEVAEGARVGLVHDSGDPRRPRAMGWEPEAPATLIELEAESIKLGSGASLGVARVTDRGTAGVFSVIPTGLGYLGPGPIAWALTAVAGATPVVFSLVPISDPADVGKLTHEIETGSEKVSAE